MLRGQGSGVFGNHKVAVWPDRGTGCKIVRDSSVEFPAGQIHRGITPVVKLQPFLLWPGLGGHLQLAFDEKVTVGRITV